MSQPDLTADTIEARLDDVEARVLGCLMEKAVLTPRHYPLTMNGLRNACNQKTGRDPVVSWHEHLLHGAVDSLVQRGLARHVKGGRARKIEHCAAEALDIGADGIAILSVLLLRGPRSSAELLEPASRLHAFASEEELRQALRRLIEHKPAPLAAALPADDGRQHQQFRHCFSDSEAPPAVMRDKASDAPPGATIQPAAAEELAWMRDELASIKDLLDLDE